MITSEIASKKAASVATTLVGLGVNVQLPIDTHVYQKAGLMALHLKPGPGQRVGSIMAVAEDIQTAAGVTARVYVDHGAKAVVAELPIETPRVLYSSTLYGKARPYTMTLGMDVRGEPVQMDITNAATPHALVAGTTGTGKSALVHAMLESICLKSGPGFKAVVYDPIHGELPAIADAIAGHVWEVCNHPKPMVDWLKEITRRMQRGWVSAEPILIVVDELADLIRIQPDIVASLMALATRGRNSRIHLLLATQNPSAKILSADLVQCMPVRVVLNVVREVDSRTASADQKIDAHKLPKPGHGVFCNGGQNVRFIAAIPDKYGRPLASDPGTDDGLLDVVMRKPAPDRQALAAHRDFALPAPVSPLGEVVQVAGPGFVLPAHATTLVQEAAPHREAITAPEAGQLPDKVYTLTEMIALIYQFNPDVSVSALQTALRPGGAQNGFRVVTDILRALKTEAGHE